MASELRGYGEPDRLYDGSHPLQECDPSDKYISDDAATPRTLEIRHAQAEHDARICPHSNSGDSLPECKFVTLQRPRLRRSFGIVDRNIRVGEVIPEAFIHERAADKFAVSFADAGLAGARVPG
jgi:hypothetical protein